MSTLQRIVLAFFSPTGGCRKVALSLQQGFLSTTIACQMFNCLALAARNEKTPSFSEQDLLVLVYPVYFGRMPWAFESWSQLQGNGAKAVIVSVYGNRAIDDAEREVAMLLTKQGFKIVGAIEAIAQHSQEPSLASGRPDAQDKAELAAMAQEIVANYTKLQELSFDTSTPLKAKGKAPCVPSIQDPQLCEKCGTCAKLCPMGIIRPEDFKVSAEQMELCLGCRACMHHCKTHTRGFPKAVHEAISARMAVIKEQNPARKPNHLLLKYSK